MAPTFDLMMPKAKHVETLVLKILICTMMFLLILKAKVPLAPAACISLCLKKTKGTATKK